MPWRATVVVAAPVIASLLAKTPASEPTEDAPREQDLEPTTEEDQPCPGA